MIGIFSNIDRWCRRHYRLGWHTLESLVLLLARTRPGRKTLTLAASLFCSSPVNVLANRFPAPLGIWFIFANNRGLCGDQLSAVRAEEISYQRLLGADCATGAGWWWSYHGQACPHSVPGWEDTESPSLSPTPPHRLEDYRSGPMCNLPHPLLPPFTCRPPPMCVGKPDIYKIIFLYVHNLSFLPPAKVWNWNLTMMEIQARLQHRQTGQEQIWSTIKHRTAQSISLHFTFFKPEIKKIILQF